MENINLRQWKLHLCQPSGSSMCLQFLLMFIHEQKSYLLWNTYRSLLTPARWRIRNYYLGGFNNLLFIIMSCFWCRMCLCVKSEWVWVIFFIGSCQRATVAMEMEGIHGWEAFPIVGRENNTHRYTLAARCTAWGWRTMHKRYISTSQHVSIYGR